MNTGYIDFLKITFGIIFIVVFILYFVYRLSNSKDKKEKYSNKNLKFENTSINNREFLEGNISLFFDSNENVIIIPYIKDIYGRGKPVKKVVKVKYPYKLEEIGDAVIEALNLCSVKIPGNIKSIIKKQGYSSWMKFSKNMKSISVQYRKKVGFTLYATKNLKNGKFILLNDQKSKKILNTMINVREIGSEIIQLKTLCE